MSITSVDETSRSGPHRRVERLLDKWSISYESEYSFPPYSVDIYLNEWHIGIEIDGPTHSTKKDRMRDDVLREHYFLPIMRMPTNLRVDEILRKVEDFITKWAATGEQRKHQWKVS